MKGIITPSEYKLLTPSDRKRYERLFGQKEIYYIIKPAVLFCRTLAC